MKKFKIISHCFLAKIGNNKNLRHLQKNKYGIPLNEEVGKNTTY